MDAAPLGSWPEVDRRKIGDRRSGVDRRAIPDRRTGHGRRMRNRRHGGLKVFREVRATDRRSGALRRSGKDRRGGGERRSHRDRRGSQ